MSLRSRNAWERKSWQLVYVILVTRVTSILSSKFTLACQVSLKRFWTLIRLWIRPRLSAKTSKKQKRYNQASNWFLSSRKCLVLWRLEIKHMLNLGLFLVQLLTMRLISTRSAMRGICASSTRSSYRGSLTPIKLYREWTNLKSQWLKSKWCKSMSKTVHSLILHPAAMKMAGSKMSRKRSMKYLRSSSVKKLKSSPIRTQLERQSLKKIHPSFSTNCSTFKTSLIFTRPGKKITAIKLTTTSTSRESLELRPRWRLGSMCCQTY